MKNSTNGSTLDIGTSNNSRSNRDKLTFSLYF